MKKYINQLTHFLAERDIEMLTKENLEDKYGIQKVDAIFVFGNDLPEVVKCASKAYLNYLTDYLVICGGIGHSTERLRNNVVTSKVCPIGVLDVKDVSEAEIYSMIAKRCYDVPDSQMLLDTTSTNCGENAIHGMELVKNAGLNVKNIILMQDPIMQRRSVATLKRHTKDLNIISYAPFIPQVDDELNFTMGIRDVWGKDRFLELVMGEIPRLLDHANGYGPKGKDFIVHVDVPHDILYAWEKITKEYDKWNMRGSFA